MPADRGALRTLQTNPLNGNSPELISALAEICYYHAPTQEQAARHQALSAAAASFLQVVVQLTEPGPERSAAIAATREAKMWASASVALEGR